MEAEVEGKLPSKVILEVKVPRDTEITPEATSQMIANLAGALRHSFTDRILRREKPVLSLEIATYNQSIHFYVVMPEGYQTYFESQLIAQYPVAITIPTRNFLSDWFTSSYILSTQMVLGNAFYYPIRTFRDFKDLDPLASVLGVMSKIGPTDQILVQLLLSWGGSRWQQVGWSFLHQTQIQTPGTPRQPNPMGSRLVEDKITKLGLKVGVRILVGGQDEQQARSLLEQITGSFGSYAQGDGNFLSAKRPSRMRRNSFVQAIFYRKPSYIPASQVLTVEEIASLWHPPSKMLAGIHSISWGTSVVSEAPENLPNAQSAEKDKINFFARTEFKNRIVTFGIKREDRRRHIYVIGKTGTGKSTLIANMAINDIRGGEGLAVIDPHGDLTEILLDYIPSYRVNDVVYFDPSQTSRALVLNPLEVKNPEQKDLVASGIIAIFHKLYANSWGPRLEHILRNTILTLLDVPDSTFLEVPKILSDKSYREKKIVDITDPVMLAFWHNEFEKMSPQLQAEAISPILNKVGQFISAQVVRNVIGYPKSTIDLEEIMNDGKILLLNLSQGRMGEDSAALLGAMVITKLQIAAMNRVNVPEAERPDFFLYVDEFQNFATTSFIKILSEARKYRLNLTLANQYTAQVDPEVQAAILGNVGTLVTFLIGASDARVMTKEFGDVYKEGELTGLANYQILLKETIDNQTSRPFFASTLPLPFSRTQNKEKVKKVSAERNTRPVS